MFPSVDKVREAASDAHHVASTLTATAQLFTSFDFRSNLDHRRIPEDIQA